MISTKNAPTKLREFQLLGGTYADLKGKIYEKGQVVKTALDLIEMFPNKFQEVGALPVPSAEVVDVSVEDLKREARAKKLERQVKSEVGEAPKAGEKPSKKGGDRVASDARGLDVTKHFAKAHEEGLEVFKREGLYHVYEADEIDPINPKGLKKDAVDAFVTKHLDE